MITKTLLSLTSRKVFQTPYLYRIPINYCFTTQQSQTQLLQLVESKVFQVLRSAAKCDQSKLSKTATFQQLGFDSLDSVELVVAMEENMGLDIPNEQAQKIATVQAAINTFYRHLNQKATKTQQK